MGNNNTGNKKGLEKLIPTNHMNDHGHIIIHNKILVDHKNWHFHCAIVGATRPVTCLHATPDS